MKVIYRLKSKDDGELFGTLEAEYPDDRNPINLEKDYDEVYAYMHFREIFEKMCEEFFVLDYDEVVDNVQS